MHHLSHFKEKNIFETMFQTEASRQRRENGVDRMQYIGYLVSEYYGARLVGKNVECCCCSNVSMIGFERTKHFT